MGKSNSKWGKGHWGLRSDRSVHGLGACGDQASCPWSVLLGLPIFRVSPPGPSHPSCRLWLSVTPSMAPKNWQNKSSWHSSNMGISVGD